jgi:hypothetical protein
VYRRTPPVDTLRGVASRAILIESERNFKNR